MTVHVFDLAMSLVKQVVCPSRMYNQTSYSCNYSDQTNIILLHSLFIQDDIVVSQHVSSC